MPAYGENGKRTSEEIYGLRRNRELMLEVMRPALDHDRYVTDMIEEAARDLLKKYKDNKQ